MAASHRRGPCMALKRPKGHAGTLVVLEHTSKVLKGNPLGDPHVRRLGVWLPPQYDAAATHGRGRRFPVFYDLVGFTGTGLAHANWKPYAENLIERVGPPDPREENRSDRARLPGLLHGAGGQSVRQFPGHRQLRRLSDARADPVRRPRIPHARLARSPRLFRQIVRRLWIDHPRHEVCAALGRDRGPFGRCVFRFRLLARLAEHAERTGEIPREQTGRGQVRCVARKRAQRARRGP